MSCEQDLRQMVQDCKDRKSKISDFEYKLIACYGDSLKSDKGLTKNHVKSLEKIWNKATEQG